MGDDRLRQEDRHVYVRDGSGLLPKKVQTHKCEQSSTGRSLPVLRNGGRRAVRFRCCCSLTAV